MNRLLFQRSLGLSPRVARNELADMKPLAMNRDTISPLFGLARNLIGGIYYFNTQQNVRFVVIAPTIMKLNQDDLIVIMKEQDGKFLFLFAWRGEQVYLAFTHDQYVETNLLNVDECKTPEEFVRAFCSTLHLIATEVWSEINVFDHYPS